MMKRGLSLVELLVGVSIIFMVALMATASFQIALRLSRQNLHVSQANYLLIGEADKIRLLRDESWDANIANYPGTEAWVGSFQISSVAALVYRDASDDIIASGGTLDPGTKKFTVTVAWPERGATTTRSLSFYLADLFEN